MIELKDYLMLTLYQKIYPLGDICDLDENTGLSELMENSDNSFDNETKLNIIHIVSEVISNEIENGLFRTIL